MAKYTIEFEVDDAISGDDFHELLCVAIHEGDSDALDTLTANVYDVGSPGEKFPDFEDEDGGEDDFFNAVPNNLKENLDASPLRSGESDFEKAAEFDAATEDACPTCNTPYEEWELEDGLWTCPGCGYQVGQDEF